MDFVFGFLLTQKKHDSVWVIVDRLTKFAHFLPVWLDYSMDRLAELYVNEIVRLHEIPLSIMSDGNPQFTSRFWKESQSTLGTRLILVQPLIHKQMDNRKSDSSTRRHASRVCARFSRKLGYVYPLMKFTYNNSYQSSISMAPYDALYGRKCRTPLCWTKLNEHKVIGPDINKRDRRKSSCHLAKVKSC